MEIDQWLKLSETMFSPSVRMTAWWSGKGACWVTFPTMWSATTQWLTRYGSQPNDSFGFRNTWNIHNPHFLYTFAANKANQTIEAILTFPVVDKRVKFDGDTVFYEPFPNLSYTSVRDYRATFNAKTFWGMPEIVLAEQPVTLQLWQWIDIEYITNRNKHDRRKMPKIISLNEPVTHKINMFYKDENARQLASVILDEWGKFGNDNLQWVSDEGEVMRTILSGRNRTIPARPDSERHDIKYNNTSNRLFGKTR